MLESRGPRIFLADLLTEHFEELVFLVGERRSALRSKLYLRSDYEFLSERQAAHVDGLVIGGEKSVKLLKAALGEEDSAMVFAASRVLLELGDPAKLDLIFAALEKAEAEPTRAGLIRALSRGPTELLLPTLQKWLASGPASLAVAAAEVLAYHRKLDPKTARLKDLLNDADPLVRRAAWRVAALAN